MNIIKLTLLYVSIVQLYYLYLSYEYKTSINYVFFSNSIEEFLSILVVRIFVDFGIFSLLFLNFFVNFKNPILEIVMQFVFIVTFIPYQTFNSHIVDIILKFINALIGYELFRKLRMIGVCHGITYAIFFHLLFIILVGFLDTIIFNLFLVIFNKFSTLL